MPALGQVELAQVVHGREHARMILGEQLPLPLEREQVALLGLVVLS